jgi:hypothetical protein
VMVTAGFRLELSFDVLTSRLFSIRAIHE